MKRIFSVVLASLLVICLLGVSPANTPVRAAEGDTYYVYLPLVSRQVNRNKIAIGAGHICAITPSGGVKCWGNDGWGALGDGSKQSHWAGVVDVVGLNAPAIAISSLHSSTCVVTAKGSVQCWGYNQGFNLGDGTQTDRDSAVNVIGLSSGVKTVSVGDTHACVLTEQGGVLCWGDNDDGELGDGTTTFRTTPVSVVGLTSGVKAISAGYFNTCAITEAGGVKCWGTSYGPYPVDVVGLTSGVIAISVGTLGPTCVITAENEVKCWYGGTDTPKSVPLLDSNVAAVSGGGCAVTNGGSVQCWGFNQSGRVGDGTEIYRDSAVYVVGLNAGVESVVTSLRTSCAYLNSGKIKCWGELHGPLDPYAQSTVPVDIIGFP